MRNFTILLIIFISSNFGLNAQEHKLGKSEFQTSSLSVSDTLTDIDGNIYKTIDIGSQTWMSENLKTTKFRDGTPIQNVTNSTNWINMTSPAYCWYNNDSNNILYNLNGALYNRFAINESKLCPIGWRIPSDEDWQYLKEFLGGDVVAGGKMKEINYGHWIPPNEGATNLSGFTGLPSGKRNGLDGSFENLYNYGYWWGDTSYSIPNSTYLRTLSFNHSDLGRENANNQTGLSIRCIREINSTNPIETDRGLIGYYPFNGDASDASGNGHNGTLNGATLTTDRFGNPNSAYDFNGEKNNLLFRGFELQSPATTITCWIKPSNNSTDTIFENTIPLYIKMVLRVVSHHYQLELTMGSNKITLVDTAGYTNFDPARARYDFLAIRFDHNQIWFIVNNRLLVNQAFNELLINYNFPHWIIDNPVYSFKGIMDDLRIYNRAISWDEILSLSNNRTVAPPVITADSVFLKGKDFASVHSTINYDQTNEITETGVCWSTSPNPEITNHKVIGCCGNTNIILHITGLTPNSVYFLRAYAINRNGTGYSNEISFKTLPTINYGSVTDIDGNIYKTVRIGTQTWMAENLKTTKYADETPLEYKTVNDYNREGKFFFVNENISDYKKQYGLLYTWLAATNGNLGETYQNGIQGVCPDEWHIPNYAEKTALVTYLGGPQIAGGKLKESGLDHWMDPNTGANNESGFMAFGAGLKFVPFEGSKWEDKYLGERTYFWTSESVLHVDLYSGYILGLNNGSTVVGPDNAWTVYGASVRCLKDTNISYIQLSVISTKPVKNITHNSAVCGVNLSSDGGDLKIIKGICWATSPHPDTTNFKMYTKGTSWNYTDTIKGLTPTTTYYFRAFALNSAGISYGNELNFTTQSAPIKDIDGNIYRTVKIGTQTWMAENLKTTKYADGTPIENGTLINGIDSGKYYFIYNNDSDYKENYGLLYTWEAATNGKRGDTYPKGTQGACPNGWHIPNYAENTALITYLGGPEIAGGKLKEPGFTHWNKPNIGTTNESGFTGLGAGIRYFDANGIGIYFGLGTHTEFMSSETFSYLDYFDVITFGLHNNYNNVYRSDARTNNGVSVRCLKDTSISYVTLPIIKTNKLDETSNSVFCYGSIISDGGELKLTVGVCWSTIPHPDTSGNKTGTEILTSLNTSIHGEITGLSPNVTYYVRTYAINSAGIAYGNELSFIKSNTNNYGDIDSNGHIQSSDASFALQYSVGLDPIPSIDPLPWESARVIAADLDNQNGITAYDASLILQYEAGLIKTFPAQDSKKSFNSPQADVDITLENGFVTFRPKGELYGFNLSVSDSGLLGPPQVNESNIMLAVNISAGKYSIGLATAYKPKENQILLKIPVLKMPDERVNVSMRINNKEKQLSQATLTNIVTEDLKLVEIFPNPTNTMLNFSNLPPQSLVTIYNSQGKKVIETYIDNAHLDISSLSAGVYFVKLKGKNITVTKKFIKDR